MPNLLAHYLLVKRLFLKEDEITSSYPNYHSFLKKNFDYLSLGTQGPDPLFYMGILPFHGLHLPTALKKYGNQIHKQDGKKYFRNLIQECYTIEITNGDDSNQRRFQAFVLGQFAHYLLDREAHPYILYSSGFDENGRITGKYHYRHAHFEAEIDYCLAKKYGMDNFLKRPEELLPDYSVALELIDSHLVPVLERTFNVEHLPKNMCSNAVKNFRSWLGYTNHGHAIRVALFGKTPLSATRLPKEVKEDVLNEQKNLWLEPSTGKEHHETFLELHSSAFDQLETLYEDIIRNGFNYETFLKYIDGKNYYGNTPDQKWVYQKKQEK